MYKKRKITVTAQIRIGDTLNSVPVSFYVKDTGNDIEYKKLLKAANEYASLSFLPDEKEDESGVLNVYQPTQNPSDNDAYLTFMGVIVERPTTGEKVTEVAINKTFKTVIIKTNRDSYTFGVWGNKSMREFEEDCNVLFRSLALC